MTADPHIGATIRRARKLLRMTQQELADKVGVSRNTVDSWENERSYPKRYDVALEQVLGISLDGAPADDELTPTDEWEAAVLSDDGLPDHLKRQMISDSRAARAAYDSRRARRAAREAG
jgi:transcriptional regulator with XRE-family HTH domain